MKIRLFIAYYLASATSSVYCLWIYNISKVCFYTCSLLFNYMQRTYNSLHVQYSNAGGCASGMFAKAHTDRFAEQYGSASRCCAGLTAPTAA